MEKTLFAALLAAIFALGCSAPEGTQTKVSIEVVNPEIKTATLAIEIKGATDATTTPRRLVPPGDKLNVVLTKDTDGSIIEWTWHNGLVTATVPVGTYTCEVTAEGFARETSSIVIDTDQLGTTVTTVIQLAIDVPSKPEPQDLGTYTVERVRTDDHYEPTDMWGTENAPAYVTYTAAFEGKLAQYKLQGELPEFTCTVTDGQSISCEQWTDVTGAIFNATGVVAKSNETIELKAAASAYVGTPDEYTEYLRYRLTHVD